MFVIGFTGTKTGMTYYQKMSLKTMTFWKYGIDIVHHGDCVGSDEQFHDFAYRKGFEIWIHPPLNPKYRAYCTIGDTHILEPKEYLKRDKDIVELCDILIATPRLMGEERRSGTWHTIRYARELSRPIYIIWPNGRIEMENKNE